MTPTTRARRELVPLHAAADAVREGARTAEDQKRAADLERAIEAVVSALDRCKRCNQTGDCQCP